MKRLLPLALLLAAPLGAAEIWSCQTNCNLTGDTERDGAWRAPLPKPAYVAATTGNNVATTVNGVLTCRYWWNTVGSVRWRLPSAINANHCVSIKENGVEGFWPASRVWPATTEPPKLFTVFDIEPSPSFNGDTVTVTWSTIPGTTQCRASWQSAEERNLWNLPLSGTKTLIQEIAGAYAESMDCKHPLVNAGISRGYRVLPRGFDCAPGNLEAVNRHVTWETMPLADWTTEYQGMAVWLCNTPQGVRKQKMLFNVKNVAMGNQEIIEGVKTIETKLRECMLNCAVVLPTRQQELLEQFALRAVMKEPM